MFFSQKNQSACKNVRESSQVHIKQGEAVYNDSWTQPPLVGGNLRKLFVLEARR